MLIRTRAASISIVVAVFGGAALAVEKLLLAAVEKTEALEVESRLPGSPLGFDLTGAISSKVGRVRATIVLWVFYGVPFVCGGVFMIYPAMIPPPAVT